MCSSDLSVTSTEGLAAPWDRLSEHLDPFEVESVYFGGSGRGGLLNRGCTRAIRRYLLTAWVATESGAQHRAASQVWP